MNDDAEKFGEELAKKWHVHGKVDLQESVCYLGSCMRDLVKDYGEEKAWLKLESIGRKAFNPIYTARKIIEYVHLPASFVLITFLTFPQKVFLSFVPQFFPFTFLTFPYSFPHFSSELFSLL